MANHGLRPGNRGGDTALGAAYDATDRALVFRQSQDGDESVGSADRAWLPEDNRHSVACTCDCHGDAEGSSSSSGSSAATKETRTGSVASRSDNGRSRSVDDGARPAGRVDNGAGAAARRAGGIARPGGTAAARPGSSTFESYRRYVQRHLKPALRSRPIARFPRPKCKPS